MPAAYILVFDHAHLDISNICVGKSFPLTLYERLFYFIFTVIKKEIKFADK